MTTLFGQYINEALINRPKASKDKPINLADFPIANINISYTDINNNKHEKSFSLSTSISTIYEISDNKNGNASVVFEVQEKFL